jgi:hypothetical protein
MQARYTLESPSYYTPLLRLELTGGTNRYPLLDGVGSTRRLMDSSGNITDFYDLEAFGILRSQSGSTANPYRFACPPSPCGGAGDGAISLILLCEVASPLRYCSAEATARLR